MRQTHTQRLGFAEPLPRPAKNYHRNLLGLRRQEPVYCTRLGTNTVSAIDKTESRDFIFIRSRRSEFPISSHRLSLKWTLLPTIYTQTSAVEFPESMEEDDRDIYAGRKSDHWRQPALVCRRIADQWLRTYEFKAGVYCPVDREGPLAILMYWTVGSVRAADAF